jgi:hypothetical protein
MRVAAMPVVVPDKAYAINLRHRLVCQALEIEKIVKVLRMWSHDE